MNNSVIWMLENRQANNQKSQSQPASLVSLLFQQYRRHDHRLFLWNPFQQVNDLHGCLAPARRHILEGFDFIAMRATAATGAPKDFFICERKAPLKCTLNLRGVKVEVFRHYVRQDPSGNRPRQQVIFMAQCAGSFGKDAIIDPVPALSMTTWQTHRELLTASETMIETSPLS